jgi:hypothetical protein
VNGKDKLRTAPRGESVQKILAKWEIRMSTQGIAEKKLDLPPKGPRNADPLTGAPGAHPIETGIGAAAGGAAAGMAAGLVGGPVSAVVGAAVGAVAGGYAGKGVGEMIDPTVDDTWLRDNFEMLPYVQDGDRFEEFQPAYRYGAAAESIYGDAAFDGMYDELEREWQTSHTDEMPWTRAEPAVRDGYQRTVAIRKQRELQGAPCESPVKDDELEPRLG